MAPAVVALIAFLRFQKRGRTHFLGKHGNEEVPQFVLVEYTGCLCVHSTANSRLQQAVMDGTDVRLLLYENYRVSYYHC